jgi:hypothetical protein
MSHLIFKTQKGVKLSSFRLEISGVQRNSIVVGRVRIVCCQVERMYTENSCLLSKSGISLYSPFVEIQDSWYSRHKCLYRSQFFDRIYESLDFNVGAYMNLPLSVLEFINPNNISCCYEARLGTNNRYLWMKCKHQEHI